MRECSDQKSGITFYRINTMDLLAMWLYCDIPVILIHSDTVDHVKCGRMESTMESIVQEMKQSSIQLQYHVLLSYNSTGAETTLYNLMYL